MTAISCSDMLTAILHKHITQYDYFLIS